MDYQTFIEKKSQIGMNSGFEPSFLPNCLSICRGWFGNRWGVDEWTQGNWVRTQAVILPPDG